MTKKRAVAATATFGRTQDHGYGMEITKATSWSESFGHIRQWHRIGKASICRVVSIDQIKRRCDPESWPITSSLLDILERQCAAEFPQATKFELITHDTPDQKSGMNQEAVQAVTLLWMTKHQDSRDYRDILEY